MGRGVGGPFFARPQQAAGRALGRWPPRRSPPSRNRRPGGPVLDRTCTGPRKAGSAHPCSLRTISPQDSIASFRAPKSCKRRSVAGGRGSRAGGGRRGRSPALGRNPNLTRTHRRNPRREHIPSEHKATFHEAKRQKLTFQRDMHDQRVADHGRRVSIGGRRRRTCISHRNAHRQTPTASRSTRLASTPPRPFSSFKPHPAFISRHISHVPLLNRLRRQLRLIRPGPSEYGTGTGRPRVLPPAANAAAGTAQK